MLRFELRHYMYLPPIFKPRIMSPLNRGSGLFVPVPPGFRRYRGSTTGLPYIAPHRGSDFGGHSSAGLPHKLVVVGENPRALVSRIFKPVKRATFQIASGGAAQRRNHSN